MDLINKLDINTIITVQHPWILPKEILKSVNYFAFNSHNAKLPDYKGYYTINHSLLNNEKYYTTTIHWMIDTVDMGEIAFEKNIKIDDCETALSLYNRSQRASFELFKKLLNYIKQNKSIPKISIHSEGKFYGKNSLENLREIKDIKNFDEVDKKSRAFFFPPFEPAFYYLNSLKLYVLPNNFTF